MSSTNNDPRDGLRRTLMEGAGKIPVASYQRWDVERVRAFKKAVLASKKLAVNPRATAGELSAQINQLSSFWA